MAPARISSFNIRRLPSCSFQRIRLNKNPLNRWVLAVDVIFDSMDARFDLLNIHCAAEFDIRGE